MRCIAVENKMDAGWVAVVAASVRWRRGCRPVDDPLLVEPSWTVGLPLHVWPLRVVGIVDSLAPPNQRRDGQ